MSSLFERLALLVKDPSKFFEDVKQERGVQTAFWWYFAASAIGAIGGWYVAQSSGELQQILQQMTVNGISIPSYLQHLDPSAYAWLFLGNFVWSLLAVFVSAAFLHAWIKMWKGTGAYADTVRLVAYSSVPGLLLSWIPKIGAFVGVYTLVLNVIAVQKLHGVSRGKAVWIFVLPGIILALLAAAFAIFLIAFVASQTT